MPAVIQWILLASVVSRMGLGATVFIRQQLQDGPQCPGGDQKCFSLSECLASSETCFTSNTTLLFDPGDHYTAGLEEFVVIRGITGLALTGSVNDTTKSSVIHCNSIVAFAFVDIVNLQIKRLSFNGCGRPIQKELWRLALNIRYRHFELVEGTQSALLLVQIENFYAEYLKVNGSYGFGLLGWNVLGYSGVSHSTFSYNNYHALLHQQKDPRHCVTATRSNASVCIGGNTVFVFTSRYGSTPCSRANQTRVHDLLIDHTEFTNGVNLDFQEGFFARYLYPGGGLSVFLGQSEYDVTVSINNVTTDSNIGYNGANMVIYMHDDDGIRRSSGITITNSLIVNGNSYHDLFAKKAYSGGLHYYYGYGQGLSPACRTSPLAQSCDPEMQSLMYIASCSFTKNRAFYGAAMYVSSTISEQNQCLNAELTVVDITIANNVGVSAIVQIGEHMMDKALYPRYYIVVEISAILLEHNTILYSESDVDNLLGEYRSVLVLRLLTFPVRLANCIIRYNYATGLRLMGTTVQLLGQVIIQGNVGRHGGGISISDEGFLTFLNHCHDEHNNLDLKIQDNVATYGGGIYVEDNCLVCRGLECFYMYTENQSNINITLAGNTAEVAGDSIYGGQLDTCYTYLYLCNDGPYTPDMIYSVFDFPQNASLTEISSDPQQVCFCEDQKPACGLSVRNVSLYPGAVLSVDAVGVGQMNGTVPTVVVGKVKEGYSGKLGTQQDAQALGTECGKLSYRVTSTTTYMELELDINFERQSTEPIPKTIAVSFISCPIGFRHDPELGQCNCIEFLTKKGVSCNIDTLEIEWQSPLWVGYSRNKIMAHDNCPLDYCKEGTILASFPDTSGQCEFSRSGVLCGQCKPGLSSVFATSRCKKCSNKCLSLLVPFALAGFLLVVLLIYCDLTVAKGTLNGLIFYANIVRVNHNIIFPAGETNVLTVFIAWLNLDLGIETCFYDGMDEYGRTWLQFVFPVYVWVMMGIIIVACRYSSLAVRVTGSNAVAVLATLFLLSYTKIQRTVLTALSLTVIPSHDGDSSTVWLYDGNVSYVNGKHAALFLMGAFAAVAFILPFTLLVLFGPLLQSKFSYRLMKLKLSPILDAYQGPYKDKFRCWTGVMLVARSILLLAFAANALGSPRLNLLLTVTLMVILLGFSWNVGTVYKQLPMNVIDTFYIINLILLMAWTEFNRQSNSSDFNTNQAATSYTLVGTAFIVFLSILVYHAGVQVKKFLGYHDIHLRIPFRSKDTQNQEIDLPTLTNELLGPPVSRRIPTATYIDIRARESLLGSYSTT